MGINITNELSEAVEKEISVTLESIKQKLLDLFDYNEVNNTTEILESFELVYAALSILDNTKGLELCASIMSVISSFKKGDLEERESLVNNFLLLKEYIDSPEDIRDNLNLTQGTKSTIVNEEKDKEALIVTTSLRELELIKDEMVGKTFWQKIHKISRALKNEAKSKEVYKIFWLNQVVSALVVKEEVNISDKDAATLCLGLIEFAKKNQGNNILTKQSINSEIKKLNEIVGGSKSARGVSYSPPQRSLFSNDNINIGVIFPVSSETIKTISYYIKNKFSSIKNSFESSIENGENVAKSVTVNLKEIHAIFNLLEYGTGEELVNDTISLLGKDLEDVSVIERIAENLVITEDLLWDLDYIEKPGLTNKLKNKANRKKDNLQIRAVKHIIGSISYDFFSVSKNEAIEDIDLLSKSDYFMLQASKVHEIYMASLISGEKTLSTILKKTECSFLFLVAKNNLLSEGVILNAYIDLLVTYEVLFNQYKTALFMDKRSIKLLDKSQQTLSSAIRFNIEAIAIPTYMTFALDNSIDKSVVSVEAIEAEQNVEQVETQDVKKDQAEEDFVVSPLESFLPNTSKNSPNEIVDASDDSDKSFNQSYSNESVARNLSVSKEIKSIAISEIDDDIFEIFLEEASEIGLNLIKSIAKLKDNSFDETAISDSRRYFHTLKGSGRMIGLNVLGEFAWQHEDLLNNVVLGAFDITHCLIDQLSKATKIVNEVVNSSPFEESREILLLSAAEAEALKYLLLGKEQVDSLLSDEDMEAIVEKVNSKQLSNSGIENNKQLSDSERELSSNEDIQSYIKSTHRSSEEMYSSFKHWEDDGFKIGFNFNSLVKNTQNTEIMAGKSDLSDISVAANKTSEVLSVLPDESDVSFIKATKLIGEIVTEIRDVLSKIKSGDVNAKIETQIIDRLDAMVDSLPKSVGTNQQGIIDGENSIANSGQEASVESTELPQDERRTSSDLNSLLSSIDTLSSNSSEKDYEDIIDSIHRVEDSMDDVNYTNTSWEALSNLENIMRRMQDRKIFPDKKEKEAISASMTDAIERKVDNNSPIDSLMKINSHIGEKSPSSSTEMGSFQEALEQFVKYAEKPAKDSLDIFQDWKDSKFKEKSLLDKLQGNVDTIKEGAELAELEGASELSSSVSNTLDRIGSENIIPSESVTDEIEISLTELDNSVKDITTGGSGIISRSIISNMMSCENAESIGSKLPEISNPMESLDIPLSISSIESIKDEVAKDTELREEHLTKANNSERLQFANNDSKMDSSEVTQESQTIDSSIQSIEQFAKKASVPVKKSLDNFSDWEESDFSAKAPLNKLQCNVEEVNTEAKTSSFDDAAKLTDSVLDTLDRIDSENIKPDSSVASDIENSLVELDKSVDDIIKGGEGSINKEVISKMANINTESSLGKPIKSKASVDDSLTLEASNSLQNTDAESLDSLVTPIKAQTDLIKEFSKKAKSPINKSLKNFEDWEDSGFEEMKPLNKLQRNVERIKENAEDTDFDDAQALTDSISNTLERIESEDIKPHKDVSDTIEQSLTELDKSVDDIEKGGNGSLSKDIIIEMAKKEAAYNIGSKIKKDDDEIAKVTEKTTEKITERVKSLDNQANEDNKVNSDDENQNSDIKQDASVPISSSSDSLEQFAKKSENELKLSLVNFANWEKSGFLEKEPLNKLQSNVEEVNSSADEANFDDAKELTKSVLNTLDKINVNDIKPNKEVVACIEDSLVELGNSVSNIVNGGFGEISEKIISSMKEKEVSDIDNIKEVEADTVSASVSEMLENLKDSKAKVDNLLDEKENLTEDTLEEKDQETNVLEKDLDEALEEKELEEDLDEVLEGKDEEKVFDDRMYNSPKDLDETILDIFLNEAKDILQKNDKNIEVWSKNNSALSEIQELQRGLHTLKGGSRMAGLTIIGDVAHYLEDLLDLIVVDKIANKNKATDILNEVNGYFYDAITEISIGKTIYENKTIFTLINDFIKEETGSEIKRAARKEVRNMPRKKITAPMLKAINNDSEKKSYDLRVSSDFIDTFNASVGESLIVRAQMDRGITEHSFQLDELTSTINRIKNHLTHLTNETEAQILFRHDIDSNNESFDPLELDRFSEIQQLSRFLSESVDDLHNIRSSLGSYVTNSRQLLTRQKKIHYKLQQDILSATLVRFDSIELRIQRIVKQVSSELGKEAKLQIYGGQVEIERNILESLMPGFEHAIRNSLAHGIESPEERERKGKKAEGIIRIGVRREGAEVWFIIADDGRGANYDNIRKKARGLDLLDESRADDENYLLQLLFDSGFSTASEQTQVSGRGIGLDVLRTIVNRKQGNIEIESEQDRGLAISIRIPFSMNVTNTLIINISDLTYAIPISYIEGVSKLDASTYKKFKSGERVHHLYGQNKYLLQDLVEFLAPGTEKVIPKYGVPVILVRVGANRVALEITEILSSQETIIKAVNNQIVSIEGIIGATTLDDGKAVPVLDIKVVANKLNKELLRKTKLTNIEKKEVVTLEKIKTVVDKKPRILIVDDSVTIRNITSKILSKFRVETNIAKDGLDAVDVVAEWKPDLILLDIEMPRMDGFEFATYVRGEDKLKEIPIIMITSRIGEKHRKRANEIGVQDYLGKPYTKDKLLESIEATLKISLK